MQISYFVNLIVEILFVKMKFLGIKRKKFKNPLANMGKIR